jgi:small subunit ribosomal protein S11
MEKTQKEKTKKKAVSIDKVGQVHIQASYNNIIISITKLDGKVVFSSSAGQMGFKGPKKNTHYAAQIAADKCTKLAYDSGLRIADVYVKGPGIGRDPAIVGIQKAGVAVSNITDVTPMPHNGCRPPKRRRP